MAERGAGPSPDWVATIERGRAEAIEAARADAAAALADGLPFKGKSVVAAINRVFGANTILVKENGGQDLWAYYWPYYQVLDEGCCVPPAEQTAMGYGVIGAMAAKLARPDRQVVCTTGDGALPDGDPRARHRGPGEAAGHLGRPRRRRLRLGPVVAEARARRPDRGDPVRPAARRGRRRPRLRLRRGAVETVEGWSGARAGEGGPTPPVSRSSSMSRWIRPTTTPSFDRFQGFAPRRTRPARRATRAATSGTASRPNCSDETMPPPPTASRRSCAVRNAARVANTSYLCSRSGPILPKWASRQVVSCPAGASDGIPSRAES
jgi:hypothetical protein